MAFYSGQHICGLYYLSPNLDAFGNAKKNYLPQVVGLKSHTSILSNVSRTVLTQTFKNPSKDKAIRKVRYTFPLYDGVSVVGFTCRVGTRIIKGVVQQKEEAKATFDKAVDRGETAGLLEQLPDASDVFTTTVGNIDPDATIVTEITYLGELKHDAEVDGIRFTIPTSIAPRYGDYPGELQGHALTSQAQAGCGMSITVDASMPDGSMIQKMQSPSHPISISMGTTSSEPNAEPSMTRASATLSLGTTELKKDFILQIVAKDTGVPKTLLEEHPAIPHQRALMATLVPKFTLPPIKPEVVFVCDRSGSMSDKIGTVVNALKVFLKSLPVGVKFNICSFGSSHSFLWDRSQSYSQSTLDAAIAHVESFGSNMGGTEILEALEDTIERRYKDIELEVMLLTDGEVWDQDSLFRCLNEHISEKKAPIRVFTLGVGDDVSHSLIEGMARAGNGFSQAVANNEKLDSKVVRMLKGALTPHITDYTLEVKYSNDGPGAVEEEDFEIVEKVADSLHMHLDLDPPVEEPKAEEAPKKPISLFDPTADVNGPTSSTDNEATNSSDNKTPYAHLPSIPIPSILQTPHKIPPLYPFIRTTVYLLLSPNSRTAPHTPTSVILRATSTHGPLELEIPVQPIGTGATLHQLAGKKATQELEEGRGWLHDARDETDHALLREKMESKFADMVEREAVRLGTTLQVAGRWCAFVAVEERGADAAATERKQHAAYLDEEAKEAEEADPEPEPVLGYAASPTMVQSFGTKRKAKRVRGVGRPAPLGRGGMCYRKAPRSSGYSATSPDYAAASPGYGATSPGSGAASPVYEPTSPVYEATSPGYSPTSPVYSPTSPVYDDDGDEDMGFALTDSPPAAAPVAVEASASMAAAPSPPAPAPASPAPTTPAERLQALISLQRFDGSWGWSGELLSLLGLGDDAAEAAKAAAEKSSADVDAVATRCVVEFLKRWARDQHETWELVVGKADGWLEGRGAGRGEEEREEREAVARILGLSGLGLGGSGDVVMEE
ncbi:uncharacterized protein K452DRAFT_88255 [Aplosporella prunicola CBS 121167]|uniref:VIT domain-containing protein n=1 Tax=Aplosporella prunicola CBS 121167 TaxID=1176127 RepID=A0A6A6B2Y4_9PEZI|nr:uncharacterized protein K452DRAFT_88255 [Aplosporella prunicola CBS 121167]KAF2138549.1 hypothetical protein K452DRAFT_88255 [Aplosporella prunicola CBS 121167]